MRNHSILLIFIALSFFHVSAQNPEDKFGKIQPEDFEFTEYAKDKSAEAVVLFDTGDSFFARNNDYFEVVFERKTRIKIFKESGIKWAKVDVPFYREGDIYEQVYEIEAYTYNVENGKLIKTKLDETTCVDEKINDKWTLKKFALPNVKAGSIIEYRYKLSSEFKFNLRNWEFQWKIPVIYSKYVTHMIPFYQYSWILQGAAKFDSQKSYIDPGLERQFGNTKFNDMNYEYIMKDVPAFKDEEFITAPEDYIIKLNFQLSKVTQQNGTSQNIVSTWPELIKDLLKGEDFGSLIQKTEKYTSKIFDLKEFSGKSAIEKYDSVLNYVKLNYKWNGVNNEFCSKNLKDFLRDKTGNSADINLFTIGLLKGCGVKTDPVLLSTRDHGKIKYDYPFTHFFNYVCVLAQIDSLIILGDATDPLNSNYRIPVKCINDQGLIIQKDKVQWMSLKSLLPSTKKLNVYQTVTDSVLTAKVEITNAEYYALEARKNFGNDLKKIQKSLIEKGYTVEDSTIFVKNYDDPKRSYFFKYKVTDKPEKINSKIYVSPFLNEYLKENPLKQQTRSYPLDMVYASRNSWYAEVSIPKDYKVSYLPENERIKNERFEFEYAVSVDADKIRISFSYFFKQPVYDAEDYLKLKYYYKEIINKGSDKIILVKK